MGAEFVCEKVKAREPVQLESIHDGLVSQAQYDYGHAGYTGSFAESPGLTIITSIEFDDEQTAEDYIYDNAKKWENALAVRIKGTNDWLIGGCFSS